MRLGRRNVKNGSLLSGKHCQAKLCTDFVVLNSSSLLWQGTEFYLTATGFLTDHGF